MWKSVCCTSSSIRGLKEIVSLRPGDHSIYYGGFQKCTCNALVLWILYLRDDLLGEKQPSPNPLEGGTCQPLPPHRVPTENCCWISKVTSVRAEAATPRRDSSGPSIGKSQFQPHSHWTWSQISPRLHSLWVVKTCHKKLLLACYRPVFKRPGHPYTEIFHGLRRHFCCQNKLQTAPFTICSSLSPR